MSAEAFLAEANDLFVDEDFEGALQKFDAAIALKSDDGNYFTKRSACYFKLARYNGRSPQCSSHQSRGFARCHESARVDPERFRCLPEERVCTASSINCH
jgi:hypothetical protein